MRSQTKSQRRISRLTFITVASIAVVAAAGLGCTAGTSDPTGSDPAAESTVKTTEALTAGPSAPARAGRSALFEPGRPVGFKGVARVQNAPQLAAGQHPGHFSNKGMNKTPGMSTAGAATPASAAVAASASASPPVVSAEKIAKQSSYLQQWQQMEPSLAALSQEERDTRRAALKKSVLGN